MTVERKGITSEIVGHQVEAKKARHPCGINPKNEAAKQADEDEFAFIVNKISYISTSVTDWLADSAASTHIACNRGDFSSYMADSTMIDGIMPGAPLKTHGRGTVPLEFKVGTNTFTITLNDVKHALEAPNNLLSIGQLTDARHSAIFTITGIEFKSKAGTTFGVGKKIGWMYQVMCWVTTSTGAKDFAAVMQTRTMDKWHCILGHVNPWTIWTLKNNNLVTGLIIGESQGPIQCTACIQGKCSARPVPKRCQRNSSVTWRSSCNRCMGTCPDRRTSLRKIFLLIH